MKREERISSQTVYDGKIIKVRRDEVRLSSGRESVREVVCHSGACAVVPILENGDIILVKQYRYAFDKYILEIPAGKINDGEEPLECIKREMAEEIGKKSEKWDYLGKILPSVGCMDEIIYIFTARELGDYKLAEDYDEDIELVTVSQAEAVNMIKSGELDDAKTVCGLLRYISNI